MAYAFAGQYGPEPVIDSGGRPVPNASCGIYSASGGLAVLYSDRTMAATAANPALADGSGQITFFAAPGRYSLVPAAGLVRNVIVFPDQTDALTDGTVATSASAGTNGAAPAQVVGYLNITISGTVYKVPYYAV